MTQHNISVIRVSKTAFKNALDGFADENPQKAKFITMDIPQFASYFLTIDGNAGFGITQDGELIALFNHTAPKGTGDKLIEWAKQNTNVSYLWCFDSYLPKKYEKHGFEETERMEWNDEQAPEDWPYEQFGRPDVIKMEL